MCKYKDEYKSRLTFFSILLIFRYKRMGHPTLETRDVLALDAVQVPLASPFTFETSRITRVVFDTVEDVTVLNQDTLSKLSKLNYNRPKYSQDEEKEPTTHPTVNYHFLCKVTQGGLRLKGGKHSLGFLFVYELFTRSPNLPLHYGCVDVAHDKPEVLGSLLLRLMPPMDTQTKGVLMSILRQVEGGVSHFSRTVGRATLGSSVDEDPDVVALRHALPAYVEGKGLFSRFGGSSHFSKFIASIAKVEKKT